MLFVVAGVLAVAAFSSACPPSPTTVSGTHAPATVCSGDLIFSDEFNHFDHGKWQHEVTLSGGGNWEFQYYSNNRSHSFTQNGNLNIRPGFTMDQYGEHFLSNGLLNIDGGPGPADRCTNPQDYGCARQANPINIVNPIKSARIRTVQSFNFRYGRVEARAKIPAGDWLWPAIWMMPTHNAYGSWPASGEIDLLESRGNRNMYHHGLHIGTHEAGSTLHFGPYPGLNAWDRAHWVRRNSNGYNSNFHLYQMEWTPDFLRFSIDNIEIGRIQPGNGGMWEYGGFNSNPNIENPWRFGSKMAPFDEQFYIITNVACGGTNGFFPDGVTNGPNPKPWSNQSPRAFLDFWNNRGAWMPTWNLGHNAGADASLQIDYIRVWAI